MNTNYCPKENFWLLINATDPLNQLDWLAKTLQESEDKNEKVHIIGQLIVNQYNINRKKINLVFMI